MSIVRSEATARIVRTALAVRGVSVAALVVGAHLQQPFDTSHTLLAHSLGLHASSLWAFVRWDTVYFLSLAEPHHGYAWEQSLAFQPGIVYLLRATGYITPSLDGAWSATSALILTTLLANVATLLSPVLLYHLTRRLTLNDGFARTAALLSVFAPAAGTTLSCPTPEPFFSLAALAGLLALERSPSLSARLHAALWFALATLFRANGLLLIGFLAWHTFYTPSPHPLPKRLALGLATFTPLALIAASPFVLFQAWAYGRFCGTAVWCSARLPNAYGYVQATYWNVGLFRYWELAQLPNFILAAPVLLLLAHGVYAFLRSATASQIVDALRPFPTAKRTQRATHTPLRLEHTPGLTPYIVHSAALGAVLLVASHVQIALRFASPGGLPCVWWSAAALAHTPAARRVLTAYLALQYAAATALYAGFYPPA